MRYIIYFTFNRADPGPGAYMLPPTVGYERHDISRIRAPRYTMSQKLELVDKSISPGPKYQTTDMTSHGKASPPAYSMSNRHKDLSKPIINACFFVVNN